jgi:hypothetical protein
MKLEQVADVRVDIPNRTDPDSERYHRRCGTIVATVEDDASELTGDDRNDVRSPNQPQSSYCISCELTLCQLTPHSSQK